MARVEPVIGAPAATVTIDDTRTLLIADYHAGIETALRYRDGVTVESRADRRRERLRALIEETAAEAVIVLGDLMHSIGDPGHTERAEIDALLDAVPSAVSFSVIKGNHDGIIEGWLEGATVHEAPGIVRDGVALSHGHTWPPADVLEADVLCIGHEHPRVRLEDAVGGADVRRVWLRGRLDQAVVARQFGVDPPPVGPELVVFPAFNELSGGTWVNVEGESFLVPYLPEGLREARAYLLDGTNLGATVAPGTD